MSEQNFRKEKKGQGVHFDRTGQKLGIIWHVLYSVGQRTQQDTPPKICIGKVWDGVQKGHPASGKVGSGEAAGGGTW